MKEIKYLIKQENKNIENYIQKQITNNNKRLINFPTRK